MKPNNKTITHRIAEGIDSASCGADTFWFDLAAFVLAGIFIVAGIVLWARTESSLRALGASQTTIAPWEGPHATERVFGLPKGTLAAVECIEAGHLPPPQRDRAKRREGHLLVNDSRIRKIADVETKDAAITSWGRYQILGIEARARGLAETSQDIIRLLTNEPEARELAAAMIAGYRDASNAPGPETKLLDALAKYNCGPSKGGMGKCGTKYAIKVFNAIDNLPQHCKIRGT